MNQIYVKYRVELKNSERDLYDIGNKIAQEQSLGNYRWPFKKKFPRSKEHAADAVDYQPDINEVKIRFPSENIGSKIPQLLNYIAGDVFDSNYFDSIKIISITLPEGFIGGFSGPQYGIEDLRERVEVDDRPLLGMVLKPSVGLYPDQIYDMTVRAGEVGVDVVGEDEKLVSPTYCSLEDRLGKVIEALRKLNHQTGKRPLYVLNVSGQVDTFLEYIRSNDIRDVSDSLVVMVTPLTTGFGHIKKLAGHEDIGFPVYAHRTGHGAYTRTGHGIAMNVIEKLCRLAGADFAHTGTVAGDHARKREVIISNKRALRRTTGQWQDVGRTMPVVSHQVSPANIHENMTFNDEIDGDQLLVAGSSIYSYPAETLEETISGGIKACQEAIHAKLSGDDVTTVRSDRSDRYEHMREWLEANG